MVYMKFGLRLVADSTSIGLNGSLAVKLFLGYSVPQV